MLDGVRSRLIWTDPPYGVAYTGKTKDALTIENDDLDEGALEALLHDAMTNACANSEPGAAWYVAAPGGPLWHVFATVLKRLGVWRHTIIWVKDRFVLGRADYHYRHEPIFYGWTEGGAHYFVDDRTQDTVWEVQRPGRSEEHPTMKPVELVERAIRNSSRPGDPVLDMFCGSGTTIIAAHNTGRVGHGIELSPAYCDVICKRFEQHTGIVPVRDGAPVSFIAG